MGLLPASSFNGGADYELSLRRLAKYSKLHVEAAVLDYDLAIQLSASNLAYAAILTSLQKTSVVEGFHPMDIIKLMSTIQSVSAGSRPDEIFVKGIGDIVRPLTRTSVTVTTKKLTTTMTTTSARRQV